MFKLFDAFMDKDKRTDSPVAPGSLQNQLITEDQLEKALLTQKKDKKGLVEVLSAMGLLSRDEASNFSNLKIFAVPSIRLNEFMIEKGALRLVSKKFAIANLVIPIRIEGNHLNMAMSDPMDISLIEKLKMMTNMMIRPFHAPENEIMDHINKMYPEQDTMDDFRVSIEEFTDNVEIEQEEEKPQDTKDILQISDSAPMVRLVNIILARAVEKGVSDIHIEPYKDITIIRYRIDGALIDFSKVPKRTHPALISRIKILGSMDISETRKPQDGKCRFVINNQEVDFRISSLRMIYGEKIVIRVLNKTASTFHLENAGFSQSNFEKVSEMIKRPNGMFLVTGPTGSGKTTTLYSVLKKIVTLDNNAITVEDPVEYELERVNQVPVNPKADITFASALRTILRQDPDIIMIGEIRDLDTAEIAVKASMTGHFVLSTLHTNDAPGSIMRLIDLGVQPFMVTYSVIGAIAQRLVRRICKECKEEYELPEAKRKSLEYIFALPNMLYRGKGCEACNFTGFSGRVAIHEVLKMTDGIIELLLSPSNPRTELYRKANEEGMKTLREDALDKAAQGITSLEEALMKTV